MASPVLSYLAGILMCCICIAMDSTRAWANQDQKPQAHQHFKSREAPLLSPTTGPTQMLRHSLRNQASPNKGKPSLWQKLRAWSSIRKLKNSKGDFLDGLCFTCAPLVKLASVWKNRAGDQARKNPCFVFIYVFLMIFFVIMDIFLSIVYTLYWVVYVLLAALLIAGLATLLLAFLSVTFTPAIIWLLIFGSIGLGALSHYVFCQLSCLT